MKIESIVENVLTELKKRQIVFINEAHFQYEFALELAKTMNVHMEWYEKTGKKNSWRVDLRGEDREDGKSYMFEFKYITSAVDIKIGSNIIVSLKNQGGHTNRKASILRDIEKLEKLTKEGKCDEACFILLTNDEGLIKSKSGNNALDILEGKQITPITIKGGKYEITIEGTYNLNYIPYCSVENTASSNVNFKALILPIKINP